jgi:succinoglycan biosynthesis transport protein ExoP
MSPPKGLGAGLRAVEPAVGTSHPASEPSLPPSAAVTGAGRPQIVVQHVDLSGKLDPRCVLLREPMSLQARSYRLLRHRLLTHGDPHVVAVTSARVGEGKTTCAINLALCIAEETLASVLLVEANPHRPSLGQVFGIRTLLENAREGGGDATRTLQQRVFALRGPRLHVVSAPAGALQNARLDRVLFRVALRDLREAFDYIIVDTASVLESADADVACECADGVIVAARAKKSRRGSLRKAIEQLRPATISGVVLLDV